MDKIFLLFFNVRNLAMSQDYLNFVENLFFENQLYFISFLPLEKEKIWESKKDLFEKNLKSNMVIELVQFKQVELQIQTLDTKSNRGQIIHLPQNPSLPFHNIRCRFLWCPPSRIWKYRSDHSRLISL